MGANLSNKNDNARKKSSLIGQIWSTISILPIHDQKFILQRLMELHNYESVKDKEISLSKCMDDDGARILILEEDFTATKKDPIDTVISELTRRPIKKYKCEKSNIAMRNKVGSYKYVTNLVTNSSTCVIFQNIDECDTNTLSSIRRVLYNVGLSMGPKGCIILTGKDRTKTAKIVEEFDSRFFSYFDHLFLL